MREIFSALQIPRLILWVMRSKRDDCHAKEAHFSWTVVSFIIWVKTVLLIFLLP